MSSTFVCGGNVSANGIRQHYLRYGGSADGRATRPAIVLIPGITSPATTWDFVGEVLGAAFDTYVLDVRGRGLSSASSTLDYSLEAQANDIVAGPVALLRRIRRAQRAQSLC
jgi:N-formylmaleamate deformylase